MTRIAFFLPDLAGGGAERVCVNLASGFLGRGIEVDFVLARAAGPLLAAVPPNVRLIDLGARRTVAAVLPLAAALRREKPEALISAPDHANLVALWASMLARTGTRVAITHHVHPSSSIRNTPKLQERLYPFLLHLFQGRAQVIVAVSQGVADDLARLACIQREHITVIYNPIVTDDFDQLAAAPCDHPWFAAGQPPVVVAAGRLTAQKDFSTLLRAFAILHGRRPARLIILGEGEERLHLEALAEQLGVHADLNLPGYSDQPFAFMSHSRVFVLSSAWEGFGNVLVEALACGTQVVATDCPSGPAEILENGKYGRLVPIGNAEALARGLEAALDAPLPSESLRQRAAAFSVEAAVDRYLQVLGLP
jgi:glycosyltransferase involved in cell wall biosynthesis